ncbi:ribosomal protein S9 [Bernardetia litoralis DSM 6794]|uniref:Small ribosomal subunit protein uS9 n=1 Tax=Bernardetia litoralis (strain ATCC 23117 / DSM 6794 / NBRC 15988 / NCIMB 1366 / Fx l1 / Sio-4) TaxID=880071 RepID=I4AJE3_BERLS|nr:30S ribosomal protein S9 [Bernardetia litoralis]AFM04078.1 ribosomal protein S9 [Bernardetia litoralis DSM 6794]
MSTTLHTLGRRKKAVARVYMQSGAGKITVNGRAIEDYFPTEILRIIINQPFVVTDKVGVFDVNVNVASGGITGQAGAVRLGISRALVEHDPELRPALKAEGFLTRDPRMVERKKPGRRKARKKFQFSKR